MTVIFEMGPLTRKNVGRVNISSVHKYIFCYAGRKNTIKSMPTPVAPPEVVCLSKYTPAPTMKVTLKIVIALVAVYFMVSAWDDVLDLATHHYFHLEDTVMGRLIRALIASLVTFAVLIIVQVHLDDLLGVVLHD